MEQTEFEYYVNRIEEEDSFFSLIEAGGEVLPMLENQFEKESSPERRTAIVRIIAEYRHPQSLAFLLSRFPIPRRLSGKKR